MTIPRHTFNTLPAKPSYLKKVLSALTAKDGMTEREIVNATGLTKTQALCALADLVKDNIVAKDESTKRYVLLETKG